MFGRKYGEGVMNMVKYSKIDKKYICHKCGGVLREDHRRIYWLINYYGAMCKNGHWNHIQKTKLEIVTDIFKFAIPSFFHFVWDIIQDFSDVDVLDKFVYGLLIILFGTMGMVIMYILGNICGLI